MRGLKNIIAVTLLGVFALGCDQNDADEPFADIAGTFNADTFEFVSTDSPDTRRDLVADGDQIRLEIEPDGRFRQTFSPNTRFQNRTGTLARNGSTLSFTNTGSTTAEDFDFTFNRSTGRLTLEQPNTMFAFDDGGTAVSSSFRGTFSRAQ